MCVCEGMHVFKGMFVMGAREHLAWIKCNSNVFHEYYLLIINGFLALIYTCPSYQCSDRVPTYTTDPPPHPPGTGFTNKCFLATRTPENRLLEKLL